MKDILSRIRNQGENREESFLGIPFSIISLFMDTDKEIEELRGEIKSLSDRLKRLEVQGVSTGADCTIFEENPGEWFYSIQQFPYGETEAYDVFGPFKSLEEAEKHISNNHANPGGWVIERYKDR